MMKVHNSNRKKLGGSGSIEDICHEALKVVWICHFTDSSIQQILKPWRAKAQFAPWISHTLKVFEYQSEIELHIISPHEYIPHYKTFERRGVHYHFFNPYIPIWGRHWPGFFKWDEWTNFAKNKRIVHKVIDSINPDVIHLQGAENPYYSSTALNLITKYPLIVNFQRFAMDLTLHSEETGNTRVKIEKHLWESAKYFTVRTNKMHEEFSSFRPDAKLFWVNYSRAEMPKGQEEKIYDIAFFSRINKTKGIEDLLEAIAILRKRGFPAKTCVMGPCSDQYLSFLKTKASSLGISDLIVWKGLLRNQDQVYKEALKARISVLPTHKDVIPGTIIESMQMGLPVVSYKAGSIPDLNLVRENVLLSEIGDIQGLAENIMRLLTDDELCYTMSQRGMECIKERDANHDVFQQHLTCYREVVADFHRGKHDTIRISRS